MSKRSKGFTLIELLVVIAIIGILSSVVLASLNTARTKGADAAVKSNLNNIRAQAELYYDTGATYGTFAVATCPTTVQVGNMFSDANVIKGINAALAAGGNGTRCVSSAGAYAISAGLKTSGQSWCIDSAGTSKQYAGTATAAITGTACTP